MKTKMKKTAAKPMMRKGGKVLPKHQTPPGQTTAPYRKVPMMASDDEKFINQQGPEYAYGMAQTLARERANIDKRKSGVPAKVQEANKTLKTQKKGGTVPKGKPMMKKTSKKK